MSATEKNHVIAEVEQALENYLSDDELPVLREVYRRAYRQAGDKHLVLADGEPTWDSLILSNLYRGLADADRDDLVTAAAIIVAAVNQLDGPATESASDVQVDESPTEEENAAVEPTVAADSGAPAGGDE